MIKKIIKQNKVAAIGFVAILLFLICLLLFTTFNNKKITTPNNGSSFPALPGPESQSAVTDEQDKAFKELTFDVEHTMQDSSAYFQ